MFSIGERCRTCLLWKPIPTKIGTGKLSLMMNRSFTMWDPICIHKEISPLVLMNAPLATRSFTVVQSRTCFHQWFGRSEVRTTFTPAPVSKSVRIRRARSVFSAKSHITIAVAPVKRRLSSDYFYSFQGVDGFIHSGFSFLYSSKCRSFLSCVHTTSNREFLFAFEAT